MSEKVYMFLSPQTYNEIYAESSGIMITKQLPENNLGYLLDQNSKYREKNKKLQSEKEKLRATLEYIAKNHADHVVGSLAKEALNGIL
jgi:hypothetical protein